MNNTNFFVSLMLVCMAAFAGAFGGAAYMQSKQRGQMVQYVTTQVTEIIPGDSIPYPVITKVPVVREVTRTDTVIVINEGEKVAIVDSVCHYKDTLTSADSSMKVILHEGVSACRITYRDAYMQNLRESKHTTTTVVQEKIQPRWYAGVVLDYSDKARPGVCIQRHYKNIIISATGTSRSLTAGVNIAIK